MSPRPSGDEIVPKPYDFVSFPRKVARSPVPGHERLDLTDHYSGRLSYRLKALTPIFVGTGSYALGEDVGFPQVPVVRPFYRVRGEPTIPGSSLKGVVRSIVEAISPSCVTVTRIASYKLPPGVELAQGRRRGCSPTRACPACNLFGRVSQSAKVHFSDAHLADGGKTALFRLSPLFAPRAFRSPPVYLDDAGKFKGRKFYYHSRPAEDSRQPPVEVLPSGQQVAGEVTFENLRMAELGLLFFALGIDGTLTLKLGGGKPVGLGSLRTVGATLTLLEADHYTQAEAQEKVYRGKALADLVGQAMDAALSEGILLREQALDLAEILTFTQDRSAPLGSY